MTKVLTSKPVNPSSWMVLKSKARNALLTATKEEVFAKNERDTKRMELERLSKAVYSTSPGFRHQAHTVDKGSVYMGNASLTPYNRLHLFG